MTDARPQTPFLDLFELAERCERIADLLGADEIPWDGPPPTREQVEAAREQNATLERWAAAERLALEWWREQQWAADDEAARLLAARAVDEFMGDALPARAGRRSRAAAVLRLLSKVSCKASLRFGAVVVEPPPPKELAAAVGDLLPEISDLLDEGAGRGEA